MDSAGEDDCEETEREAVRTPRVVFLLFISLLGLGVAGAQAPWGAVHAILFCGAGLLMVVFPPAACLPVRIWMLAGIFALSLGGAFLPDGWFPALGWRRHLGVLGLDTGTQVTAQPRAALEIAMVLLGTLAVGLWIASHRPSPRGLRFAALVFTLGVAGAALLAMVFPALSHNIDNTQVYGFFPNRNHNATLLAMGAIAGLGCLTQAIREHRGWSIALAAGATLVCLWAILSWSISRAGVVLLTFGTVSWMLMLGSKHLGPHALKAVMLLAAAAVGGFFIAESDVKNRLNESLQRLQGNGATPPASPGELDFRIPTWLDTLDMIRDRPWTGVGAGQFVFVFPQYRQHTATATTQQQIHPESDWLWMAAEAGVPATMALAGLVTLAGFSALRGMRAGRSRALRAACLVAGMLIAVHGLVDVPGHRVPLAWSAALLVGISMRCPGDPKRLPNRGFARLGGAAVLAIGLYLAYLHGVSITGPATTSGQRAESRAMALYREDQKSLLAGNPVPLDPAHDPLLKALGLLNHASATHPMDGRIHHLRGVLAMHFSDMDPLIHSSFAYERALDPTWVQAPLLQAIVWLDVNPQHTAELFRQAQQQAKLLDAANTPPPRRNASWAEFTERQIRDLYKANGKLRRLVPADSN